MFYFCLLFIWVFYWLRTVLFMWHIYLYNSTYIYIYYRFCVSLTCVLSFLLLLFIINIMFYCFIFVCCLYGCFIGSAQCCLICFLLIDCIDCVLLWFKYALVRRCLVVCVLLYLLCGFMCVVVLWYSYDSWFVYICFILLCIVLLGGLVYCVFIALSFYALSIWVCISSYFMWLFVLLNFPFIIFYFYLGLSVFV